MGSQKNFDCRLGNPWIGFSKPPLIFSEAWGGFRGVRAAAGGAASRTPAVFEKAGETF